MGAGASVDDKIHARITIESMKSAYQNNDIAYTALCKRISNVLKEMPLSYFEPTINDGVAKYARAGISEQIQVTHKCLLCAISQHLCKKQSELTYDEILTSLLTKFCSYLRIDLAERLSDSDRMKLNEMIELGVTSITPKTEDPNDYSSIVSLLIERNICLIVLIVDSEGTYNWDHTQIVGNHVHDSATQFIVIKNLRGVHFEYLPQLTTLFYNPF